MKREFLRGVALVVVLGASSSALAQNAFVFQNQEVQVGATNVSVPVLVTNSEARHGLGFSIKYDQTKLLLKSFNLAGSATATAQWDGGVIHQADGEVIWGIVMGFNADVDPATFNENLTFPAGTNVSAGFLIFDVTATQAGTAAIQFKEDLASFAPQRTLNRLTTAGVSVAPTLGSATLTIIDTPPPGSTFLRGDCNADGGTGGVGDAIFHLTRNFIGGVVAQCLAACDANADGDVGGVGDAIYNLTRNFIGGVTPVPPFNTCGGSTRPQDIALGCVTSTCTP